MERQSLTLTLLSTGHCRADESHVYSGGRRGVNVDCRAIVAVLSHPTRGTILLDTGYAPRVFDAAARFPYSLYLRATPIRTSLPQSAVAQLSARGIPPESVGTVILTHFHADHLAGLRDFPTAKIVCRADAVADISGRSGFAALRRAFLPALLPPDFQGRVAPIETFAGAPLDRFGPTHDLFGDGLLRLVSLPGHARGQLGVFARTTDGPVFFIADAAYSRRAIRENRPPAKLTRFFVDNYPQMVLTLKKIHDFAAENPEITIVPTHCPELSLSEFPESEGVVRIP